MLRKEDNDWVRICVEYELDGPSSRARPVRTCREVIQKVSFARKLNREDAMDRSVCRKLIRDG